MRTDVSDFSYGAQVLRMTVLAAVVWLAHAAVTGHADMYVGAALGILLAGWALQTRHAMYRNATAAAQAATDAANAACRVSEADHQQTRTALARLQEIMLKAMAESQTQLGESRREIERVQGMLADAIDQLVARFAAAHAHVEALAAGQADTAALTAALKAELDAAMTAMQFQDLVNQLLDHVKRRDASVAVMLGRTDALATQAGADLDLPAGTETEVEVSGGRYRDAELAFGRIQDENSRNPVEQAKLAGGTVELF